jgi:hypothetical protein
MKDSIVYNASEIGSLLGAGSFQKPWETLARVWKRYDRDSYAAAGVSTEKETVDAMIEANEAVRSIVDEARGTPTAGAERIASRAVELAASIGLTKAETAAVAERVRKEVFCSHGIREEAAALRCVGGGGGVLEDTTFKKRSIGSLPDGTVVEVGGRLDGYTDDGKVVEVKNRVGGLAFKIPDYEVPQVLVYMYIVESDAALHIERISLADGSSFSCTHEKRWDDAEWEGVRRKLLAAAAYVRELATDEKAASKFAKSRIKNALIKRKFEVE